MRKHVFVALMAAVALLPALSAFGQGCPGCGKNDAFNGKDRAVGCKSADDCCEQVVVGAGQPDKYIPLLKGKRVALFSNHTGMVGDKHTLDLMLENGINVACIFSPEHGFRGTADAGEHVSSGTDPVTGIRIASLYDGKKRGPSQETMDGIDIIVTDILDVGLRYYT